MNAIPMISSCRACAWLCSIQTLEVGLKLFEEGHVLYSASGVRRGRRRDLVIDRLEVPGKTLQTHCRRGLESSLNGTIVIVH